MGYQACMGLTVRIGLVGAHKHGPRVVQDDVAVAGDALPSRSLALSRAPGPLRTLLPAPGPLRVVQLPSSDDGAVAVVGHVAVEPSVGRVVRGRETGEHLMPESVITSD